MATAAPVQPGEVLAGKYRIEHVIASGGMGVVVAATHLQLDQRVALKFMLPDRATDPVTVERFIREGRAAARLRSEHVARVIDVGKLDSGVPYIVMEYLQGTDLATLVRRDGALPEAVAADYVIQALDALAEAHTSGIVHRDLKPGNLFVTRRADGSAWVKVLDFGASKVHVSIGDPALTRSQSILGSPAYMSPEQLRSARKVDMRSDIWSLGVVLYELVCGKTPFAATAFSSLVIKVYTEPVPSMAAPHPFTPAFEEVVKRCLEKDPSRRYQNVAELAEALAPFAPAAAGTIVGRVAKVMAETRVAAFAPPPDTPARHSHRPTPPERSPLDTGAVTNLHSASQAWHESGRPPDLLWDDEDLAEYKVLRARYPGALTEIEEAFAQASLCRARRKRRGIRFGFAVALAVLGVGAALLYRTSRESEERRLRFYIDQGREAVLAGDPMRGLIYLGEAYRGGARDPALDFLIGTATRALGGEILTILDPGRSVGMPEFSPDGTRILTSGGDGLSQIWDAKTGRLVASLRGTGPRGWAGQSAFSPDSRRVAVRRAGSHAVDVWDAETGERILQLPGHTQDITAILYSPDGRRILTSSHDKTTRLWSAETGELLHLLRGPFEVNRGEWSPDGRRVAMSGTDGSIQIWDAETGLLVAMVRDHRQNTSVLFSPDGKKLASASWDSTARIRDAETGESIFVLNHARPIDNLVFSPDGKRLVTSSQDRTARVWDVDTGVLLHSLEGHAGPVFVSQVSADGNRILTTGGDETARLWDARTGEQIWTYVGAVWSATFDATGTRVVASIVDGTARVWNARKTVHQVSLEGHDDGVTSARFSPDGARVLTAGVDRTIRLWDAATGRELAATAPEPTPQGVVTWNPAGDRFLTVDDAVAKIWDVRTMTPVLRLVGHTAPLRSVGRAGFSPDGRRVVTAGSDHTARIWDAASGRELLRLDGHRGPVNSAEFSPDGRRIATASDDETCRIWSAATGALLVELRGHVEAVTSAVFDRKGTRILTTGGDRTARIWDARSGELLTTLEGHTHQVNRSDFHRDGTLVATASIDGTAKIWDARDGRILATIRQPWVGEVSFSPEGRRLLTASRHGTAKLWEIPVGPTEPGEIDSLLRCRIPFALHDDHLVASKIDLRRCRANR